MKQGLLIIDVQNDYFPDGKFELNNTGSTLQNTLQLQTYFREQHLPIFYIQHIKPDHNANFFAKGSVGAKIHQSLLPINEPHEYVIQKAFPNSFYQTDLQQKLKQEGIEQLIICGMMTHMCVDSTTRYAAELNYKPILIHDACTTRDLSFANITIPAQSVHISFMAALMNFATIVGANEFIGNKD